MARVFWEGTGFFWETSLDGEIDADKLDYLLRDSHYCGVRYGKYDLERILDTVTVVPTSETAGTAGQSGGWPGGLDRLEDYLFLDDCTVWVAIREMRQKNEWARRIYDRDHLSEAFVSLPQHTGLAIYMIFSEMKKRFEAEYGNDQFTAYVDDKARKLPTNPFFGLRRQEEGKDDREDRRFVSIMVQDKHVPTQCHSIFDCSLPLRLLSRKNVNLVQFYVSREKKEAGRWCNEQYLQIKSEVNNIEQGWT